MREVLVGSTDISVYLNIVDSTDGTPETGVTSGTAGLSLKYIRNRGTATSIGTINDLAAVDSAHNDAGIRHVENGVYRVDLPDAAVAAGVDTVEIEGTVTGMVVLRETLQLVGYNPRTELTSAVLARIDENVSAAKTLANNAITAAVLATDAGTELAAAVWDRLTSNLSTASSIGKLLVDNVNATISSRSSHSAADVWTSGTRTLTSFGTLAQDVWDKATSALTTAGSIGKKLADWTLGTDNKVLLSSDAQTGVTIPTVTTVTNAVTAGTVNDKTGYSLSSAGVQAIWDALTSALTTAGSIGKLLVDNINATISSRSSHSAADVWAVGTRSLTTFGTLVADIWANATRTITGGTITTNNDKTGYRLSAAGVDDIWDEDLTGHATEDTAGKELADASAGGGGGGSSAADVWEYLTTEAVPDDSYGALLIERLDTMVSAILAGVEQNFASAGIRTPSEVELGRADTWAQALAVNAFTWSTGDKLLLTLKERDGSRGYRNSASDASDSVLQWLLTNGGSLTDGLTYVNMAAAADRTKGSLSVVSASGGSIIANLDETISKLLRDNTYAFDVVHISAAGTRTTLTAPGSRWTVTPTVTQTIA